MTNSITNSAGIRTVTTFSMPFLSPRPTIVSAIAINIVCQTINACGLASNALNCCATASGAASPKPLPALKIYESVQPAMTL